MSLHIDIRKKLPHYDLDIEMDCSGKSLTIVIGPSGSGKSTLMRIISGLEKPDNGVIAFGNEIWFDSDRRFHLPPQKRRIGYVFQDYALFPHLTVEENISFASKDKQMVRNLLALFGLSHLKNRKPQTISGGESQRCAICQALAREPQVLLLDEPFSALDVFTRRDLREELKGLREDFPMPIIYVTHDVNEAFYLADTIIPVVDGRVDKDWLQRSLSRVDPSGGTRAKSVREPKLQLAY
ncbi:MAG: molybdate transport system ATP-binding protein [Syntrophus sp. SKADARSKE-3]|nr:molybdate transport system ATP-binding protein [Syntrophus sp. SKADARSKE-3]